MQKKLLIIAVTALVLIGGVVFVWQKKTSQIVDRNPEVVQENTQDNKNDVFITDVDSDMSHWQTRENKVFFTVKFPKEWYWLESDLKKTGYYSQVITNNPNFDINKYADISFGTGGSYHVTSQDGTITSIPLQDDELVISFRASATEDVGTPQESIDSILRREGENLIAPGCSQLSAPEIIPVRAYCSFVDAETGQKIQTYFIANKLNTMFFSARTTETTTVPKDILDKIAESMTVKETL